MAEPILALITPLTGSGGTPTHPIAPGGPPPSVWPSPGHPAHPIAPGGVPGLPTHPIAPLPGYPDNGLPDGGNVGTPEHPIVIPPQPPIHVEHPIPPTVWPGVPIHPETPTHPIELPPGSVWPPLPPAVEGKALVLAWIPGVGIKWVVIDTGLHPAHPIAPGGTPPAPSHPIEMPPEPTPSPQS